jgi:hypothetical protein
MRTIWEDKREQYEMIEEKIMRKIGYRLWDKTKDIINDEIINDGVVIKDEVFPNRIFYLE